MLKVQEFYPTFLIIVLSVFILNTTSASESQATTTKSLRWAHVYEPSHPLHKWAEWASREVFKQSNGRYQIEVFPSSSLGKEAHLNQSLSLGSIDIIYTGTSFAAQAYKPLGISEMPYIFSDYQHWQRLLNSSVFKDMAEQYRKQSNGNVILSSAYYGVRHLSSNRPVLTPADIKGLKIRTPGAFIYQLFPLSLGAQPSPISFSEVYLALQQGVVDAQENPLTTIQAKKFYEVQTNINLTGHILGSILTITNERFWLQLNHEDKRLFQTVLTHAAVNASNEVLMAEQTLVEWFKKNGVQVNIVDRSAFRAKVLDYYRFNTMDFDKEIYEKIQNL